MISDEQKRLFYHLHFDKDGPRLSVEKAGEEAGISKSTSYRLSVGVAQSPGTDARNRAAEMPDPLSLADLSQFAVDALADFSLFSWGFFARRPSPLRLRAAKIVVEALRDKTEKTFIVLNMFPGSGKSTLLHDIKCWLCAGGDFEDPDPERGRAIRMLQGSFTKKVSKDEVLRMRRSLELKRPYYDKDSRERAEYVLQREYGRFKPDTSKDEESVWAADEFLVAQIGEMEIYDKEPTLQAASRESGFLGERSILSMWDDLVNTGNSRTPEVAEALAGWVEKEAETRVEPGGLFLLCGQRIGPNDLYRNRLDAVFIDEDGSEEKVYHHIVFPVHQENLCDGKTHGQWNGQDPDEIGAAGCLTDEHVMPWREILKARSKTDFETLYQQADVDPARVLVQQAWLDGRPDYDGYPAPGCYDLERAFLQWPDPLVTGPVINYAVVDPAAGKYWAIEWWCVSVATGHRYLIWGKRDKLRAGDFLDWNNEAQEFSGLMFETQMGSILQAQPIRIWIVEAVAAHRYLEEFEHYHRFRRMFPDLVVIPHQTQNNKNDPVLGVEAGMPMVYKTGMKHLPKAYHPDGFNYLKVKERELTTYPMASSDDTVMADWMGEWNMDAIMRVGVRPLGQKREVDPDLRLPKYLTDQTMEFKYG